MAEPPADRLPPNASPGPRVRRDAADAWPLVETLQSSLLGLIVACLAVAPRIIPVLVAVGAILTVVQALIDGRSVPALAGQALKPLPMTMALALLGWAALSGLWSSDRDLALSTVAQVVVLVLGIGILSTALPRQIALLPEPRRMRFIRALPLGGAIALAFILIELATGNRLSLAMLGQFPGLMGDNTKDFIREGDRIVGFPPFFLDRNVAALTLSMPAVAMAASAWLRPERVRWAVACLLATTAIAVLGSSSETAKLAVACGAVAAAMTAWRPAVTLRALKLMLVGGVLLALPLGHLPSRLGLEHSPSLPPSARERAMIWDRTAKAAWRVPPYGIGVQSTRHLAGPADTHIDGVTGNRRELGWHAHNFALQTWLELGLVGALLLLGLAVALLEAISRLDQRASIPAAAATLAIAVAVAVTGWGMWQPWLLGAMGMAIANLAISQIGTAHRPAKAGKPEQAQRPPDT